jgi:signal peptidase I
MRQGRLYINGDLVKRRPIDDYVDEQGHSYQQYVETLPGGMLHRIIQELGDSGPLSDTGEFLVEPGHYFMMGDNRDDSLIAAQPKSARSRPKTRSVPLRCCSCL